MSFVAQAQAPSGKYAFTNACDKYGSKTTFMPRKNGTIKAAFCGTNTIVFSPIKNQKNSYLADRSAEGLDNHQLDVINENVVLLYETDKTRKIWKTYVFANDKKAYKAQLKKMGLGGMSLKEELQALKNANKPVETTEEDLAPKYLPPLNPTSDFHAKNADKIVFFSEKPTIGQEDMSKVKTSFKAGEAVWAIAYLPAPLGYFGNLCNAYQDHTVQAVFYYVYMSIEKHDPELTDGERPIINSAPIQRLKDEDRKKNYLIFQVIPALDTQEKNEMDEGGQFIAERLGERVESYKHTLEVALIKGRMHRNNLSRKSMFEDGGIRGFFEYDATEGTKEYVEVAKN